MTPTLPQEIQDFISRGFNSLALLELLIALHASRDKHLSVDEINHLLKSNISPLQEMLDKLVAMRLAQITSQNPTRYQYFASDPSQDELVALTVAHFPKFRHRITELIYRPPSRSLKNFSDAFKFKKGGPEDG